MPPKAPHLSIDGGGRSGTLEQAGSSVLSPSLRTAAGAERDMASTLRSGESKWATQHSTVRPNADGANV